MTIVECAGWVKASRLVEAFFPTSSLNLIFGETCQCFSETCLSSMPHQLRAHTTKLEKAEGNEFNKYSSSRYIIQSIYRSACNCWTSSFRVNSLIVISFYSLEELIIFPYILMNLEYWQPSTVPMHRLIHLYTYHPVHILHHRHTMLIISFWRRPWVWHWETLCSAFYSAQYLRGSTSWPV